MGNILDIRAEFHDMPIRKRKPSTRYIDKNSLFSVGGNVLPDENHNGDDEGCGSDDEAVVDYTQYLEPSVIEVLGIKLPPSDKPCS